MCVSMSFVFVTMSFMSILGLIGLCFFGREGGGGFIMHVNILVSFCYYFVVYVFVLLAGFNSKTDQSNPAKPTRGSSGL
jgi:predicted tellurium resistance membrane protein TerC